MVLNECVQTLHCSLLLSETVFMLILLKERIDQNDSKTLLLRHINTWLLCYGRKPKKQ